MTAPQLDWLYEMFFECGFGWFARTLNFTQVRYKFRFNKTKRLFCPRFAPLANDLAQKLMIFFSFLKDSSFVLHLRGRILP